MEIPVGLREASHCRSAAVGDSGNSWHDEHDAFAVHNRRDAWSENAVFVEHCVPVNSWTFD